MTETTDKHEPDDEDGGFVPLVPLWTRKGREGDLSGLWRVVVFFFKPLLWFLAFGGGGLLIAKWLLSR